MDKCISPDRLARYVKQNCSKQELKEIENHLEMCDVCSKHVQAFRKKMTESPVIKLASDSSQQHKDAESSADQAESKDV